MDPRPLRVALQNVGCKLNHYEVEAFAAGFAGQGFEVVPFGDRADLYVVNTCTVTGSGDADSRKAVRRARRANPQATVVATGCYAQRQPEALRQAGAHLVVGNGDKAGLVAHVQAHLRGGSAPSFDPDQRPQTRQFLRIEGGVAQGRTRGSLQIQDGCDEHCTYCIIPQVRGPGASRPAAEVVAQARGMVAAGYRELALTGVHTGSYGQDQGESLVHLLRELESIEGLQRLRLNSIEPGYLSDRLIEHAVASPVLCRHFHVPLQSGDDRILRRMNRRYTGDYYADRIETLARRIPGCALGADVMVGFPGEGEDQFISTLRLIDALPLTYLHVFSYSLREGTPAQRLEGRVDEPTKAARTRELIALGRKKRLEFHRRALGQELQVLVEEHLDPASGLYTGLSDNFIRAVFPGRPGLVNCLVEVEVQQAREDLVYGELA
ncbi:MAG: tRNA (N(6)-L-threonylcarbamoyladenosine(37)-C(2))-methylthiotransferase MtaB [Candidatus Handelsmanbacteria bacterium]|nr:tRNA (N(6)-L-threonylcarbamoyladenosine(37)-C(2))-methylthiotransferase MtaB [Candidatus Handelsmanbacteria bacterium]